MKKKIWWLVIIVILIVGGMVVLSSRPSVGKVNTTKIIERKIEPEKILKYDGTNLSFEYRDQYTVQVIDNQSSDILENVRLVGKSGIPVEMIVTLKKDTVATVGEVSGVKMRQLKKEEYVQENINWNGVEGILFKKLNGFELTAFFVREGKSMTLSMTSNTSDEKATGGEFEKMLGSVVWK